MNIESCIVFLDFDGVICDSVIEGFVSSWLAYYHDYLDSNLDRVKIQYKNDFINLRPYIRTGEDFMLIHELLCNNIKISNQNEFDFHVQKSGKGKMARFKELLHNKRKKLLKTSKEYWLSLNRIYPHMKAIIGRYSTHKNLHILSTKKSDLILELLKSHNFEINANRVHYSCNKSKLDMILEILQNSEIKNAVFIDDQVDHLSGNNNNNINVYLAEWGYIKKERLLEPKKVKTINIKQMQKLLT